MQLVKVERDEHTVEYGIGDCDNGNGNCGNGNSGCYNGNGE